MTIRILRRRGLGNTSTLGIKAKSKNDIEIIRNDKPVPNNTNILIRWGCTSQFPSEKTLNKVKGIQAVNNKYTSRKVLQEAGVNVPTLYANDIVDFEIKNYPVIVRKHFHSQGRDLYLCNNQQEVQIAIQKLNAPTYISEYIKKDREFGVFVFKGRVWSVVEKTAKNDAAKNAIAWNVAQGTHKFLNVRWNDWPVEVCKEALNAFKCFDLDFGRVDLIVKDGKPYVLELNSAHSLTSDYRHEAFSKCLDYYVENGELKEELDLENIKSYKSIIHPALRINKLGKNL